ncbi:hypothetical protein AX16_004340 [Volvariella volvacea WC 439]|nr:hypothetical protein AX16_004340 [Volvariella volvacea WC 439]
MSHHDNLDGLTTSALTGDACGVGEGIDTHLGLRIASVFVIFIGSCGGALFPILAKRSSWLQVPKSIFDFAKYFGSGVIIATAFVHLLASGIEAFDSECIADGWREYPYALALCQLSIFILFIVELVAFRWGTAKLARIGTHHDAHGHSLGVHAAHGPEGVGSADKGLEKIETRSGGQLYPYSCSHSHSFGVDSDVLTQIIGVAILEFGVALHSILIGLALAVDEDFKVLFVVLVFHQTFEGLAIGTRLAHMNLAPKCNWVPIVGAILYGLTTPIGIAAGLGVRSTYNPGGSTASIVTGVLDSISAGILFYTGLVELLAHEFLFNKGMATASNGHLTYAVCSMLLGCALMSLLAKWA